jgi:hypothetical protein
MEHSLKIDFIGIGAIKCGTTWLFYALGQHPKVCLSEPKEIRYFNVEDFMKPYVQGKDELPFINSDHKKDFAWYAKHYKHCPAESLKGEFSPQYLCDEHAPSRIHQHFPGVKLLVSLRNPIEKLHSSYWSRTRYTRKYTNQSFEESIEHDPRFLREAFYAKHLKRYLKYFQREQIKVVLFEDIVQQPEQTIRDVFSFLSVDPEVDLDLERIPKNKAKKSRFFSPTPVMAWFARFMIEHDQAALLQKARDLGLKEMLLKISTVDCPREPIDPQTQDRLQRLFHDDICELEALLGRNLTAWK